MGVFLVYIIKSSVCLAAFYLFFRLLLSRETFHRFNRIAVLGILCLSLVIPLCEITIEQQTDVQQPMLTLEQLLMLANASEGEVVETQNTSHIFIRVALLVYLLGILFFIGRSVYSFTRMWLLLRSGKRNKIANGSTLIVHNKDISPFSWMKYVAISQKDLDENGREILIHELAHIRNRHSIDLIIADICILFQWFNPAAWLLKQELQNIHEYEADETVINEGIDAKQYQLLLIKKAVGTRLYSMANSFNHSKLKKRITMMLKEKSNPWARLKYLYILPVAAIAVTAFARPEVSRELEEISAVKVNDLTAIMETNNAETPSVEGEPVKVVGYATMPQTVGEVVGVTQDGKNVRVTKAPSGDGYEVTYLGNSENDPLVFIDGKEASASLLSALNPDAIESISVLKDATAVEKYGDKGKNGAILITLKKNESTTPIIASDIVTVKGSVKDESGKPVIGASVLIKGTNKGTITNMEGNFSIESPENALITISYIDKKSATVKAKAEDLTVVLEAE